MNNSPTSKSILDQALAAHRGGRVDEALAAYRECLARDPGEVLALYGMASTLLMHGDIAGYDFALKALFNARASTLDKARAAESIIRLLLKQHYQDHARTFLERCDAEKLDVAEAASLREAMRLPTYLDKSRYDARLQRELERYRPIESPHYVYAIDIVGGCNLRCPTCPVWANAAMPKGLMALGLYQKILAKIKAGSKDGAPDIWLFNWTEPLLHPDIGAFITVTHDAGFTSMISTNLNIGQRIEDVMRANPTQLKISLSSLKQEIYGQTHARGDIATVIANLHELAKARDHFRATTTIWIGHHLYRNTVGEQAEIKALADSLGFGYAPSTAIVAPIERVMKMKRETERDDVGGLRDQLLYDPLALQANMARHRSGKKDCELRFNMTAIQHDGTVNLCCGTTQGLSAKPVDFLSHPLDAIEAMKYDSAFCKACMNDNLHLTIADR